MTCKNNIYRNPLFFRRLSMDVCILLIPSRYDCTYDPQVRSAVLHYVIPSLAGQPFYEIQGHSWYNLIEKARKHLKSCCELYSRDCGGVGCRERFFFHSPFAWSKTYIKKGHREQRCELQLSPNPVPSRWVTWQDTTNPLCGLFQMRGRRLR